MDLVPPLLAEAHSAGVGLTLIAFDLPTSGYSTMLEHTDIAPSDKSNYPNEFPILDFYEQSIIGFIGALDEQMGNIKNRIVAVLGGSLGGSMGLRLGRNVAAHPWTRSIVAWSPASVWNSFHGDVFKGLANNTLKGRMTAVEQSGSRHDYFNEVFDQSIPPDPPVGNMWYRPDWPCLKDTSRTDAGIVRKSIMRPSGDGCGA